MNGTFLLIIGSVLIGLAILLLGFAWRAGYLAGGFQVSAVIALMGLTSIGFGLILTGVVVTGLLIVAVMWVVFALGLLYNLCQRKHLKWIGYFAFGIGGLVLVVLIPAGLDWWHLYFRGVSIQAAVVSAVEDSTHDPDADEGFQRFPVTYVTYQFEAEVGGQRRLFRRLCELSGRYRKGTGFVSVLYDPANPDHSRMAREFTWMQYGLMIAAVFLVLGVVFYLISNRGSEGRIDLQNGQADNDLTSSPTERNPDEQS